MHNKAIINKIWWELLREGVPVSNTDVDELTLIEEYGGGCMLTSSNILWLKPLYNSTCFYTDAAGSISLRCNADCSNVPEAIRTLGEAWRKWSSEHNVTVPIGYLYEQMRECICDTLQERGVPAQLFNDGYGVAVHNCTLVSYGNCYFDVCGSVTCKEDMTTFADKIITISHDNMNAIMDAITAFAERYTALPHKESTDTAEPISDKRPPEAVNTEPMSDTIASLGKTLDDGFNYRSTCAKCLTVISKGLEANPDDAKLWHLHSKFVNSMKEIE